METPQPTTTSDGQDALQGELGAKYDRLRGLLTSYGSAVVAFSAGVDSTLLLKVAHDQLGERALAVAGISLSFPAGEAGEARTLAAAIGAELVEIPTDEMANESYLQNPPNRCFHCKSELFTKLNDLAAQRGYAVVLDGSNADDAGDFRPGMQAGRDKGVRSPLREAALTKSDIRALSKYLGLPTWNKPAMACLSSRIPYGQRITVEKLGRIEQAEAFLRRQGFSQVRVRCHDEVARIEILSDELTAILNVSSRGPIVDYFKNLGFAYVTLDLQGYRSGSMNETIRPQMRVQ